MPFAIVQTYEARVDFLGRIASIGGDQVGIPVAV